MVEYLGIFSHRSVAEAKHMEGREGLYRVAEGSPHRRGSVASVLGRRSNVLDEIEPFASDSDDSDDHLHDDNDLIATPCPIPHLGFCYHGDAFYQRGLYTEALLYLSRLPRKSKLPMPMQSATTPMSSSSAATIPMTAASQSRRKAGVSKLTPMSRSSNHRESVVLDVKDEGRDSRMNRKRQCAYAIDAMAANPMLHPTLFADNVVPTLLSLCRSKDGVTSRLCVSALCHLSGSQRGRELMLQHGCLSILQAALLLPASPDHYNILATFANLSIEDSFESMFVKEKALESMVQHRKSTDAAERLASFTLFNLSCPSYTYPRINDVMRALVEHGRDCRDRLLLSQAFYNLTATKSNRMKIVAIPDAFDIINVLVMTTADPVIRSNALHSLWCLSDTEGCRRALIVHGAVRALVTSLKATTDIQDLRCIFATLDNVATESLGCEEMANVGALSSLAHLTNLLVDPTLRTSVYKCISLILAGERNVVHVDVAFFELLVSYSHSNALDLKHISRYVLHGLGCLLAFAKPDAQSFLHNLAYLPKLLYHVLYKNFEPSGADEYLQAVLLYNMTLTFRPLDIAKPCLARLLHFGLDSPREDIRAMACGMLFNLFQEPTLHEPLLTHDGVLDVLVKLLQLPPSSSFDLDTPCKCLDIICVVLDQHQVGEALTTAVIYAVFPTLVKLCERGDSLVNAGCAACFARFGMVESCRVRMVRNGLIASLSLLAGEDNPDTLQLVVSTYSQLSCDPTICRELIENGIVHSLASLAAAPEEDVRRACAIAFCNLSTNEDNIVTLVKHGALKALLVISCVKSNDAITRRMCMKAVMNLMRAEANIPTMCNDGLPWAFTIFAMSSEEQDFPILADAFCGLSFYRETRRGLAKASTLTCFLHILHRIYDTPAGATMLKGILNLLTDIEVAPPLLNAGLLGELNHLAEASSIDIRRMVAQILTAAFQSSPEARSKYMEEATLHIIGHLLKTHDTATKHCCAILLHVLSLDDKTVRVLILNDTMTTVLDTIRESGPNLEIMLLLMRAIYNISCRDDLLVHVCKTGIVSSISYIVSSQGDSPPSVAMCAAIMRNLSCEGSCHAQLVNDHATTLLVSIFNSKNALKIAKEDAAIGVCNLLLGRVNSSVMLAQGALTPILWLCAHAGLESNILCSAVLRKLAMPPGNIQQLVDEGAVPCVVSLLETTSNLYIKRNCTATFCLLARKHSVKPSLAANGVISLTLDLLDDLKKPSTIKSPVTTSIEKMSIDLVTSLAEFVRPNVAGEQHISSMLFQLIDVEDGGYVRSTACEWEQDREFLVRAQDGPLPLAKPSAARQLRTADIPTLHVPLFPILSQGYSEGFTVSRDQLVMRKLESVVPTIDDAYGHRNSADKMEDNLDVLRKVLLSHTNQGNAIRSAGWKKLVSMEFSSQKMFPKLRTPFAPMAVNASTGTPDVDKVDIKPDNAPPPPMSKDKVLWRTPPVFDGKKSADEAGGGAIKSIASFTIQHAVLGSPIRASPRVGTPGRRVRLAPVDEKMS
ncbi:hypothetical protein H310_05952 [Aphanomyces invadans]|uniref:Armadillo repeat-containing domain-containing protein n=1 Tax=Aphanomyces invadans TaxID=157072 RepID=A0A024U868_9STRA|nr:hypothetical protein H310_05952 [Aphanomyces invadans]ETW02439.1 hypothetical protein H310_05952 [Aphanomyces invadans]|eukprot:XP_008869044.1 hypothetical protein H310_05952 [Aphanomyces invadans]